MTGTSTRLYEVSGLDTCLPDSLDFRFTDDPSQPSCLQNRPRQSSESVGPFYVSVPVVFSESHDGNDMQLQIAVADSKDQELRCGPILTTQM